MSLVARGCGTEPGFTGPATFEDSCTDFTSPASPHRSSSQAKAGFPWRPRQSSRPRAAPPPRLPRRTAPLEETRRPGRTSCPTTRHGGTPASRSAIASTRRTRRREQSPRWRRPCSGSVPDPDCVSSIRARPASSLELPTLGLPLRHRHRDGVEQPRRVVLPVRRAVRLCRCVRQPPDGRGGALGLGSLPRVRSARSDHLPPARCRLRARPDDGLPGHPRSAADARLYILV